LVTVKIIVKDCSTCPGLHQNSEFPESHCSIAKRDWGYGWYIKGPSPDWCPLRKSKSCTIKLEEIPEEFRKPIMIGTIG
jgi:hypothetical protein